MAFMNVLYPDEYNPQSKNEICGYSSQLPLILLTKPGIPPQPGPMRLRRRRSTLGGTRPPMSPPKLKTSFNMRELTKE